MRSNEERIQNRHSLLPESTILCLLHLAAAPVTTSHPLRTASLWISLLLPIQSYSYAKKKKEEKTIHKKNKVLELVSLNHFIPSTLPLSLVSSPLLSSTPLLLSRAHTLTSSCFHHNRGPPREAWHPGLGERSGGQKR